MTEIKALLDSYNRKSAEVLSCTDEFVETIKALRSRGQSDVEAVWNAAAHVNLLYHDQQSFALLMGISDDWWSQSAAVRAIATLIYEGCGDLLTLFNKPFRDACIKAGVFDAVEPIRIKAVKALASFQKKYEPLVKPIRMASGAHRDHDPLIFINSFKDSDFEEILDASNEFDVVLHMLARLTDVVFKKMNVAYRKKGVID